MKEQPRKPSRAFALPVTFTFALMSVSGLFPGTGQRAQFVSLSQSSFTADSSSINAVNFSSTCADEALSVAAMRISNPDRAAWIAKIER
jgi:hypothetical protein